MIDATAIPTLILAAGQSSRMGDRDKLLETIDGVTILRRQVGRALESGPVIVTLPDLAHPRAVEIPQQAEVVAVRGGMADSIRAGVAALPAVAPGVVILPADMPDITGGDIATLKAAVTGDHAIIRATTADGTPGHPIYFARETFNDFRGLEGDRGAFQVCQTWAPQTKHLPLSGQRARLDLDTPEDWDRYRDALKQSADGPHDV